MKDTEFRRAKLKSNGNLYMIQSKDIGSDYYTLYSKKHGYEVVLSNEIEILDDIEATGKIIMKNGSSYSCDIITYLNVMDSLVSQHTIGNKFCSLMDDTMTPYATINLQEVSSIELITTPTPSPQNPKA